MRMISSAVLLMLGAFAGMILALSCSDNSPGNADVATCDCSTAEPLIMGRTRTFSRTQVIPANDRGISGTECPLGAQPLHGSCTTDNFNPIRDVTLEQSGFSVGGELGWSCFFRNNEPTPDYPGKGWDA